MEHGYKPRLAYLTLGTFLDLDGKCLDVRQIVGVALPG
jgi:hypothetical protein